MIASLFGKVEAVGSDWLILNVSGIGFKVYLPTSTLGTIIKMGQEVKLHIHLHLREDNVTLYGFSSPEELRLFETLLGVSGLGPKLSLAMLSTMSVAQLTGALAAGNADVLIMIPGIGKKLASRLILELKDKIGAAWTIVPGAALAQENADVLSALTSLGYSVNEAARAVGSLPAPSDLSLEDKIKLALQYFGGK